METKICQRLNTMQDSYDPDQAYEDMLIELKGVIQEQIFHLRTQSKAGKITENEKRILFELIRQVRQLAKEELEAAAQAPDDVLERIVNRDYVRKHRAKKNDTVKTSAPRIEDQEVSEESE
jgi:hypothetical protein